MAEFDAITFKQLRALRAVADHGSITAAADAIGLTPPAVHTQLRTVEANMGCKLLERRSAGGMTLTPEGEEVVRAEKVIQTALTACMEKLRALRHGQAGVVVLGVVSTGKYFAPSLVVKLQSAFPDIDVILKIGNRDMIISALQQGAIELAIMGRPPRNPPVIGKTIGTHPHVIIAAPENPLSRLDVVTPEALLKQTFIAREQGSGTRILMTRYLDRIGEGTPYRLIEMGTNETIKQAVIAQLGVAMISRHTVTEELKSGRLTTLRAEGLPIDRTWYLIHREDLPMTPTLRNVHSYIHDQKGSFLPTV